MHSFFRQRGVALEFVYLLTVVTGAVMAGFIGMAIGNLKNNPLFGFFFGFTFGPIGWLIVAIGPDNQPKCPYCKGAIVSGAIKCKNCGSTIPRCPACKKIARGERSECKHCGRSLNEENPRDLEIPPRRATYSGLPVTEHDPEEMRDADSVVPDLIRDVPPSEIRFPCPGCGKSIKAKARMAGRQGCCPGCGCSFVVP